MSTTNEAAVGTREAAVSARETAASLMGQIALPPGTPGGGDPAALRPRAASPT